MAGVDRARSATAQIDGGLTRVRGELTRLRGEAHAATAGGPVDVTDIRSDLSGLRHDVAVLAVASGDLRAALSRSSADPTGSPDPARVEAQDAADAAGRGASAAALGLNGLSGEFSDDLQLGLSKP